MTDWTSFFSPEQLLGRPSAPLDVEGARERIAGRRIIVTGAAGSVGGPLVCLLARLRPAELLLLDHHEHSLFQLRQKLGPAFPVPIRWFLADVRDRGKLSRLFQAARPEIVFHLAAYKHVPLGEENPDQTVDVNLGGVRALIEAAAEAGVERFIYPSSDKAVNPPSVYGATKRVAEAAILAADREFTPGFSVSRFVNIVGTRGSVIEIFFAQIEAGKPLTLTDPGMTRYWMTMPEATRLLVQTCCAPEGGMLFMSDLGQPINLAEMARHLFSLVTPGREECPIQFIGARQGERMHEILRSDSEAAGPTPYPGIVQVTSYRAEKPTYAEISHHIDSLLGLARAGDLLGLRASLLDLANTLQ